jgi:hypothetical protein
MYILVLPYTSNLVDAFNNVYCGRCVRFDIIMEVERDSVAFWVDSVVFGGTYRVQLHVSRFI